MEPVNVLAKAQENLKVAQRLYDVAKVAYAKSEIPEKRLAQLAELRDIAAEDLQRVLHEQ